MVYLFWFQHRTKTDNKRSLRCFYNSHWQIYLLWNKIIVMDFERWHIDCARLVRGFNQYRFIYSYFYSLFISRHYSMTVCLFCYSIIDSVNIKI